MIKPLSKRAWAKLTPEQQDAHNKAVLLETTLMCEGAEVPRDWWHLADELVAEGKITLGRARGPGGDWKRALPVDDE